MSISAVSNEDKQGKLVPDCFHCGEICSPSLVKFDHHEFCCEGCSLVYDILMSSELNEYYDIEKAPGIRFDALSFKKRYNFLDNPEISKKFLDFEESNIAKTRLFIPQMHCSSCIWLLENLQSLSDAVIHSQVDFPRKKLSVTFDQSKASFRDLIELLAKIGYAPELQNDRVNQKSRNRSIYLKLGVAGFCFGNIMLMSFPEYLDETSTLSADFKDFFGIANLLLSIPVILYSGVDYIKSSWKSLRIKQINIDIPITLGIFSLFFWSTWEVLSKTGVGYFDSLAGLIFFLLIGKWYQGKTYDTLSYERDYKSYFPLAVSRSTETGEEEAPIQDLKEGDIIRIRNQEIIPVDASLISDFARIDYSFVSGESTAIKKNNNDLIFAGGRQMGSSIKLKVEKAVDQSYLTQLWNERNFKDARNSNLRNQVDFLSKYFTIAILIISLSTGLVWYFIDPSKMIFTMVTVLIIACPCALALALPFTFGNSTRILGRLGYYLKSSQIIETLSKIDHIVFDKTGTITKQNDFRIEFHGSVLKDEEKSLVKSLTSESLHPISQAITSTLSDSVTEKNLSEFVEAINEGVSAVINDHEIRLGSANWVNTEVNNSSPGTRSYLSINGVYKGFYCLSKGYRTNMSDLLRSLRKSFRLHLLSGDNNSEEGRLKEWFGEKSQMSFEQKPEEKLNYIQALQTKGARVMMIGDGLNDAGALKQSDVGIAISDDVFGFSPACDLIVEGEKLSLLNSVLLFSKRSNNVVKLCFIFSLAYNSVGLFFAVQGMLTPIIAAVLMPLSSLSVILFSTLVTRLISRRIFKS